MSNQVHQYKYHTVYKTTNLLNGKYYIGKHSTNHVNDEYLGSGKYLWSSINKYGIDNFRKKVLYIFFNEQEAFEREVYLLKVCKSDPKYSSLT
jgi:hypothetical protein